MDWRLQHKFACLPLLELYGWVESDAESTGTVDTAGGNVGGTAAAAAAAGAAVVAAAGGSAGASGSGAGAAAAAEAQAELWGSNAMAAAETDESDLSPPGTPSSVASPLDPFDSEPLEETAL